MGGIRLLAQKYAGSLGNNYDTQENKKFDMRLPEVIEREIVALEREVQARGGQQAGTPRLRGLRSAIELVLLDYQQELREARCSELPR